MSTLWPTTAEGDFYGIIRHRSIENRLADTDNILNLGTFYFVGRKAMV